MIKPFAALLLILPLPLLVISSIGASASSPHSASAGAQAGAITIEGIPSPRQLWQLTDSDGLYAVLPGQILIITGVGQREGVNTNIFEVSVDGVVVMGGAIPQSFLTYPTGYRVDPGQSVQVSAGSVTLQGYLSSYSVGKVVEGVPTPSEIWNRNGYAGTYVVPNDKVLVLTGVTHPSANVATPFRIDVNGANVLNGHVPSVPIAVSFSAGYRVPPGGFVDLGPGMYFGYQANL